MIEYLKRVWGAKLPTDRIKNKILATSNNITKTVPNRLKCIVKINPDDKFQM